MKKNELTKIKLTDFCRKISFAEAALILGQPESTINELSRGVRKNVEPFVITENGKSELYLKKNRKAL